MFHYKTILKINLCVFFLMGMLVGCSKNTTDQSAKQRLESYISKSFAIKGVEDREELVSFLIGPTKVKLSSWSDEQFRRAFIETERKYIKLVIRETKDVSQNEVSITYELSYFENPKKENTRKTARRNAILIKEDNVWYIKEVKNISEIIEYSNEMSLP